jgi:hypothetical protein
MTNPIVLFTIHLFKIKICTGLGYANLNVYNLVKDKFYI